MDRHRKEEPKKQRRTFRSGDGDDDTDEGMTSIVRERKNVEIDGEDDGELKRAKLMDEDLEERDAFVARMLEREEQKTKKSGQGNLSATQIEQMASRGVLSADQEDTRYV